MSHVLSLWAVVGLKSEPHRAFWRANLGQAVLIIGTGPVKGNICVKNRQLFFINYASCMWVIILIKILSWNKAKLYTHFLNFSDKKIKQAA